MECILPSEAARLVLGYLFNQEQCLSIARAFLESSIHLVECRRLAQSNRYIQTEIHGYSLEELLDEFCMLNTLILEAAESRNIELSPASKLSDKLKAILVDHNESSASCEGSSRKRKRSRIAFSMPNEQNASQDSLFTQNTTNLDLSQIGDTRLARETPSKLLSPEYNFSGSKTRSPCTAGKRRSGTGTTPNKTQTRTDNEISDESMLDFSEIFSRALDNKELHESLASSINKALTQDAAPAPDRELDSVVQNVVNDTQSDPCFARFLDEIIAGPAEDETATRLRPLSPQPPKTGRRAQAKLDAGIKSRLRSRTMTYDDIVQQATNESPSKQSPVQTQAPLMQALQTQAPLVQTAPLQATVSYTVPVTAHTASRVTILPSLEPPGGGQPSLADLAAIQSVFIGGLANYGASVPGLPAMPVFKRWKMTDDGYVNILPKPRGRTALRRASPPTAAPRLETPKALRKRVSPRARKSRAKGSRSRSRKIVGVTKPKTPPKLSTITVLPSSPVSPNVLVHVPGLPLINSPVRSMPVVRNLRLLPAQAPIISPPIIAHPIVAPSSYVQPLPTVSTTLPVQENPAKKGFKFPRRPVPNLVSRKSVGSESVGRETCASVFEDRLVNSVLSETSGRDENQSVPPALMLFDSDASIKASEIGTATVSMTNDPGAVSKTTAPNANDGAVPSTSMGRTRKGRKAVPTKTRSPVKVGSGISAEPVIETVDKLVGDGEISNVTKNATNNNAAMNNTVSVVNGSLVSEEKLTNNVIFNKNSSETLDTAISFITVEVPNNSAFEKSLTTLPPNKTLIDNNKPSTSKVTNNIIDKNVPVLMSKSTKNSAPLTSKAKTNVVSNETLEIAIPSTSKITPNENDTAVASTSTGKMGRTPKQRKKCLSTPRRGRPHVRALDFSTPPKPRGAVTSPKVKRTTPPRRPANRKALLFKSPEPIREEEEEASELTPVVVVKRIITEQEETDKAVESICAIREFLAGSEGVSPIVDVLPGETVKATELKDGAAIQEVLDPKEVLESDHGESHVDALPPEVTSSPVSIVEPTVGGDLESSEIACPQRTVVPDAIGTKSATVTETRREEATPLEAVEPVVSRVLEETGAEDALDEDAEDPLIASLLALETTSRPQTAIVTSTKTAAETPTPIKAPETIVSDAFNPPTQVLPPRHITKPLVLTSLDDSVEAQIKSYVIGRSTGVPIATRVPTAPLSSAWDRHTGVGQIIAMDSPRKQPQTWDSMLRSLATPSKTAQRYDSDDSSCSCDPKWNAGRGFDEETDRAGDLLAKCLAKTPAKSPPVKARAKPKSKRAAKPKKPATTKRSKKRKTPAKEASPGTQKNLAIIEERFATTRLEDTESEGELRSPVIDKVSPESKRPTRSSKRNVAKPGVENEGEATKPKPAKGKSKSKSPKERKRTSSKSKKPTVVLSAEDKRLAALMTLQISAMLAGNKGAKEIADDALVIDEDADDDRISVMSSRMSSECRLRLSSSDEETPDAVPENKRPPSVQKEYIEMARIQPLTRPPSASVPVTVSKQKEVNEWDISIVYKDNGPKKTAFKCDEDIGSYSRVMDLEKLEGEVDDLQMEVSVRPFKKIFSVNVGDVVKNGRFDGRSRATKPAVRKVRKDGDSVVARMQPVCRPPAPSVPVTTIKNIKDNEWEKTIIYSDNGPKRTTTEDHSDVETWSRVVAVDIEDDEEVQVKLSVDPFVKVFSINMGNEIVDNGDLITKKRPKVAKRRLGCGDDSAGPKKHRSDQALDPHELLKSVDLDKFLAAVHGETKT